MATFQFLNCNINYFLFDSKFYDQIEDVATDLPLRPILITLLQQYHEIKLWSLIRKKELCIRMVICFFHSESDTDRLFNSLL